MSKALNWIRKHVYPWTWKSSPNAPTVTGIGFRFKLGRKAKKKKAEDE